MEKITDYIVPLLLLGSCTMALRKKENAYDLLLRGGQDGLKLVVSLIPTLVMLLTAVTLLRSSGAMDWIAKAMTPVFRIFGIPPETGLLVLIRPISGSAALAVGTELMLEYGVDSSIGRTVAIMLGSTETTFYTISVYFGAAGIRKTRYTLLASLFADCIGFFMASLTTRLLFSG